MDRVVLGRHGPVEEWHEVVKNARRIGVAEDDARTVDRQELELDGLDGLFLLADDLRVLHPGFTSLKRFSGSEEVLGAEPSGFAVR